ncbi:unnamed protein product [Adineta ricciae]|uniref:Uncharacterized protein n=1 Tax=Adineta ricciae TaxID=249248 RepID=A0A814A5J8_ADIRI|nr:unnamed protein product [Adineta ricciae]CAF0909338.1 unnamed protein product [Adineta ricciae]
MPLQDVSNDSSMIDWLRQAGHGHLIAKDQQYSNISTSASLPSFPHTVNNDELYRSSQNRSTTFGQVANFNKESYDYHDNARHYTSLSPPPPMIPSGCTSASPYHHSYNQSTSLSPSPNINNLSYNAQYNSIPSSVQFQAPHMSQFQTDADIEHMKHDPNTRVIHRPPENDVVYRQRVFVKYLQPPTPPVGGAIIVREKQLPQPPPDPPLVIRRAPPPPPTPPPVVIRERPPPIPPPEGTTIINKIIPPPPKPPRQVIIEQYPQLPPKPRDVILEKWLPVAPRQRRIFYERLPPPRVNPPPRPIVVQHGQPPVRIHRQVIAAPGPQPVYHHASHHTDLNQILMQAGTHHQPHSFVAPSSLVSYSPYTTFDSCHSGIGHPYSNVTVVNDAYSNVLSSSPYGLPLSHVYSPNPVIGLGAYGSSISSIPSIGCSVGGHSSVFTVPEHVGVDSILHQLGVDPHSLHSASDPHSAVAHVWNAASHAVQHNLTNPSFTSYNTVEHHPHLQITGTSTNSCFLLIE